MSFSNSAIKRLIRWVRFNPPNGMSPREAQIRLLAFCAFVEAPNDLLFIGSMFDLTGRVMESLERVCSEEHKENLAHHGIIFHEVKILVQHLLDNESAWKSLIKSPIRPGKRHWALQESRHHVMHGRLEQDYLFAMAISRFHDQRSESAADFDRIKAIVLVGHWQLKKDLYGNVFQIYRVREEVAKERLGDYFSSVIRSVVFTRQCSDPEFFRDNDQLKGIVGVDSFVEMILDKPNPRKWGSTQTQVEKAFSSFFAYAFLGIPKQEQFGRGGGGRRKGKEFFHGGYVTYTGGVRSEQINLPEGGQVSTITLRPPQTNVEEWILGDLDLLENPSSDEWILPDSANGTGRLLSRRSVRHVEMRNQHLRTDWSNASLHEIARFFEWVNQSRQNPNLSAEDFEIISLALIIFWTGNPLEHVIDSFRWIPAASRAPLNLGYGIDQQGRGLWTVTPHLAVQLFTPEPKQQDFCEQRNEVLHLPDMFGMFFFLDRAFSISDRTFSAAEQQSGMALFTRLDNASYRRELTRLLGYFPDELRLNEHRLARFLWNRIVSEHCGDVAEGILITGRYDAIGQTLLHYSAFNSQYLEDIYCFEVGRLFGELGRTIQFPLQIDRDSSQARGRIGSQLMPKAALLKKGLSRLLDDYREVKGGLTTVDRITSHNLYALYTALMVGYATGYRAVTDPFPEQGDIDVSTGLCVISDKDGEDFFNARMVWMPPRVIQQHEFFREYCRNIQPLIWSQHPESRDALPEVFLLSDDLKPISIRPGTVKSFLEPYCPLPLNTNRRFLRTRLREMGCSAQAVNAFMGHWGRGQEPWGRFSSVALIDLVDTWAPYIERILDELNFHPLRGPG